MRPVSLIQAFVERFVSIFGADHAGKVRVHVKPYLLGSFIEAFVQRSSDGGDLGDITDDSLAREPERVRGTLVAQKRRVDEDVVLAQLRDPCLLADVLSH